MEDKKRITNRATEGKGRGEEVGGKLAILVEELLTERERERDNATKSSERIEKITSELEGEKQRAAKEAEKSEEEKRRIRSELQTEQQRAREEARKWEEKLARSEEELQTEKRRAEEEANRLQEEQRKSEEMRTRLYKEYTTCRWMLQEEKQRSFKALQWVDEQKRELQEHKRRALQERILGELKINVGKFAPSVVVNILRNWLAKWRFLLILKDVWEYIDLEEIGAPPPTADNGSKVIIIPTSKEGHMHTHWPADVIIHSQLTSLSKDQEWRLLKSEAMDAVTTLPLYPGVAVAASTVLECLSYVSLFPRRTGIDATSLKEFWRSEGFLHRLTRQLRAGEEAEEEERAEEWMQMILSALLAQLCERCILSSDEDKFRMLDGAGLVV